MDSNFLCTKYCMDLDSFRLESDIFNDPNYEPYRLDPDVYKELDLDNFRLESDIYNTQHGDKSSAGQMNTGYYGGYCGGQVLDSYRLDTNLPTGGQVLDSYRFESDLPAGCQTGINMSSSMVTLPLVMIDYLG